VTFTSAWRVCIRVRVSRVRAYVCLGALTTLVCGGGCAEADPLASAASDLQCPKGQLKDQARGERQKVFVGCGRKVLYVYVAGLGWSRSGNVLPDSDPTF
jgi:hypothetical protein